MKKYLLGLFAIALAIGFSAFTAKHPTRKATNTYYYWFDVSSIDGSGNITPVASPEFSGTLQDHATAADPLQNATGCDDSPSTPACIGGYDASKVNLNQGVATSVKTSANPSGFEQPDDTVLQ